MANIFVGNVHPAKTGADQFFTIAARISGEEAAGTIAETGCKMTTPS
jgi:branched-chain amino acid transport system substrate-binding protein